eukprot:UN08478
MSSLPPVGSICNLTFYQQLHQPYLHIYKSHDIIQQSSLSSSTHITTTASSTSPPNNNGNRIKSIDIQTLQQLLQQQYPNMQHLSFVTPISNIVSNKTSTMQHTTTDIFS